MNCVGCGGSQYVSRDGLCQRCFLDFVEWARHERNHITYSPSSHGRVAVAAFELPEVQVRFDEWLELGRPKFDREHLVNNPLVPFPKDILLKDWPPE